ncbi:hypothetical protein XO10_10310 [Marinitoga sp. 1135]|uniref:Acetyltransferase, ribosomal protein N-acetylase n=1 Tax=Marinitoga piezophila (strain DSM 14283 / JCM 11233 / KA3) TaxID=443254 RepID=H2J7I4_MARPK|nr:MULTISPECIES: GNAT family protein [Marinitoga]AEX86477.1 acetyltransferase, ribosomal protein N-acetylase [Marinitoga piezophila KA3]APT76861.1 hypothetical protein LN42_11085 [Marinitoga sp. 1137]NUU96617.1 hypothetical protein [Marinitoga sp. 1135]NUU98553.1 hypothetical protein [Marinitoga sp. 1138]
MRKIYRNDYGDFFFHVKDNTEIINILENTINIPKRNIYFFSEVKNDTLYINNIGKFSVFKMKNKYVQGNTQTFLDFIIENEIIYSILKLLKKINIPFTVWDLINFYKSGYTFRFLGNENEILAFYIVKNNKVELMEFSVYNPSLILQALNDIKNYTADEYLISLYPSQEKLKNALKKYGAILQKEYYVFVKGNHGIHIDYPNKNDSKNLLDFFNTIFENSETLLTTADEFDLSEKEIKTLIDFSNKNFGFRTLIARYNENIIANCDIQWNLKRRRIQKTAKLGVSVLERFRGIGIGRLLIKNHITWCLENPKIHRLELEVFSNNPKAYELYKKLGFIEEGKRREAVYIKNKYYDIIMMGIITEPKNIFLENKRG